MFTHSENTYRLEDLREYVGLILSATYEKAKELIPCTESELTDIESRNYDIESVAWSLSNHSVFLVSCFVAHTIRDGMGEGDADALMGGFSEDLYDFIRVNMKRKREVVARVREQASKSSGAFTDSVYFNPLNIDMYVNRLVSELKVGEDYDVARTSGHN